MEQVPDPLAPAVLGPVRLRNRVIKAATFEGLSHDGLVTTDLVDFHRRYAAGGVGMTTVAYLAVSPEGRTSGHQVHWRDEAMPGLRALTEAVHAEGAAVSAQIGHAGPVADPKGTGLPAIGPGWAFPNQGAGITRPASSADLERIVAAHADAARRAVEVGFDAVEIHLGHSYLASAFLSPKVNHRKDGYGGSLANRAKVARGIMRAVRDEVGDRVAIIAKLNMTDGVRGGITLEESIRTACWLEQDGTLDALEMTAGSSLLNPMFLFRGDAPVREFAAVMPQPIRTGVRLMGKRFIREYPYHDLYLLEMSRKVRAEVSLPMILLGGVVDAAGMETAMREGFAFVAMARALLREPDLVNRISRERSTPSLCIHCNQCMPTNFTGTHCPVVSDHTSRSTTWGTAAGYA
ncbi:NADH:flavin oxidoreductase [Nocardioides terrisoli]|uniref:NADH:flavin oxidoreductase n=1 Tax=Nocardioides terrisoli TaxID=3388267 RepID=UPI00287BA537|nr:NADH:flavin oxidoreductase [Nocardioides marmorisolisilvae]